MAYDLDFFEPDRDIRREDVTLYGEERLIREISNILELFSDLD